MGALQPSRPFSMFSGTWTSPAPCPQTVQELCLGLTCCWLNAGTGPPPQAEPCTAWAFTGLCCLPAYVLPVKVEMEMVIQQYEKAKVIQDEQLERLTQICQEQGVRRDNFWPVHFCPRLRKLVVPKEVRECVQPLREAGGTKALRGKASLRSLVPHPAGPDSAPTPRPRFSHRSMVTGQPSSLSQPRRQLRS